MNFKGDFFLGHLVACEHPSQVAARQRFRSGVFCAEEIVLSHLSSDNICWGSLGPTDQEDQHVGWIMGAAPTVPLADLLQNLVAGVLRHDHNQRGTHGSDGIVNYEPRS